MPWKNKLSKSTITAALVHPTESISATIASAWTVADSRNLHKWGYLSLSFRNIGEFEPESWIKSIPDAPAMGDSTLVLDEQNKPKTAATGFGAQGLTAFSIKLTNPKSAPTRPHASWPLSINTNS